MATKVIERGGKLYVTALKRDAKGKTRVTGRLIIEEPQRDARREELAAFVLAKREPREFQG